MTQNIQDFYIKTDRLLFRVPTSQDVAPFNAMINQVWDELQLWMSWAYDGFNTIEATHDYVTKFGNDQLKKGGLPLLGFCKETNKIVISTGLTITDNMGDGEYSTGYFVAEEFLGKGFATEATAAVIQYAFNALNAKTVYIDYYEGNDKSQRIIEKLGFQYVETLSKYHKRCSDGTLMDQHCYKMDNADHLRDFNVRWGHQERRVP